MENLLLGSRGVGRIVKAPMEAAYLTGEHRASLVGIPADRDNCVDIPVEELFEVLGSVSGDIDTNLFHHFDRLGVDISSGLRASTVDIDEITRSRSKDAFGKVTAAGIAGAEDEDERFHWKK